MNYADYGWELYFFLIAMKSQSNPSLIVIFVVGMCEKMSALIQV